MPFAADSSNEQNNNGEQGGDLSENDVTQKEAIKVCVRIRPMSNKEKKVSTCFVRAACNNELASPRTIENIKF